MGSRMAWKFVWLEFARFIPLSWTYPGEVDKPGGAHTAVVGCGGARADGDRRGVLRRRDGARDGAAYKSHYAAIVAASNRPGGRMR